MSGSSTDIWPFDVLELDQPTTDKKQIKRAYARKLKTIDQNEQLEDFQGLREAYQAALEWQDWQSNDEETDDTTDEWPEIRELESFVPPAPTPGIPPDNNQEHDTDNENLPDTDWQRVAELIDTLTREEAKQDWKSVLRETLNDPVFSDPNAMSDLESAIFNYLSEQMVFAEDDNFHLPEHVDIEAVTLINDQFGWLTDYVYFQNRFWEVDQIMIALTNITSQNQPFFSPSWKENPRQWFFEVFLSFRLIWLSIVIGVFSNYVANTSGFATGREFTDIMISTLLVIIIAVLVLKALRWPIEIILDALQSLYRRYFSG